MAGRDKQFRPVIVINVDRIDLKKVRLVPWISCKYILDDYRGVPGRSLWTMLSS